MTKGVLRGFGLLALGATFGCSSIPIGGNAGLGRVNHIVVVMQENHSFDNYFGALPYSANSPYTAGPCDPANHTCIDGLSCDHPLSTGTYQCRNSNLDEGGARVAAFHLADYCVRSDLDHEWPGVHQEVNYGQPNQTLENSANDGFVLTNDVTRQPDNGTDTPKEDEAMGFYTEYDLGYYYALAKTFAISDRHFSSVLGPTFPNRSYFMAGTSFGHLASDEVVPDPSLTPFRYYRPARGTIFDLLDQAHVSWAEYFTDVPQGASFRDFILDPIHFRLVNKPAAKEYPLPIQSILNAAPTYFDDAKAGHLPAVVFISGGFGTLPSVPETDEHAGSNIRAGQRFVAQVVQALRASPNWKDSILFVTHDEHGGFYDHVAPPAAPQGGLATPDGVSPAQCSDASNPPASEHPGGGVHCSVSVSTESAFCPGFTPNGPFPSGCATFNQLGVRVPLMAVSPFSKGHYVSHQTSDHASFLALIERRFLTSGGVTQHLTARDAQANPMEDLFDFDRSPSLNEVVDPALALPSSPNDPGCAMAPAPMAAKSSAALSLQGWKKRLGQILTRPRP